jgi:hypothetical protein
MHLPCEVLLAVHIIRVGESGLLDNLEVLKNVVYLLANHHRIVSVLSIQVFPLVTVRHSPVKPMCMNHPK